MLVLAGLREIYRAFLTICIICSYGLLASPALATQPVTMVAGGTGSGLEIVKLLGEAYGQQNPGKIMKVVPSLGSGGGIKALLQGKLSFSVSARDLKSKETEAGAVAFVFARSPMVFLTRNDNPASEVDLHLLKQVYTGQATNWPDGTPVRIVMRPLKETDNTYLRALSPQIDKGIADMVSGNQAFIAMSDQKNAEALEKVPGSLGFGSLGQMRAEKRLLKPLAFQGKKDALEHLKAGDYPYVKTLRLVSLGQDNPDVMAFFDFIRSAEGKKVLERNGFLTATPSLLQ